MPIESLLGLVGELRGRIGTHGDSLRQSEWLTRYALIDPLLRELGWDTSDLDVVIPEFSVDGAGEGRGGIVRGLVNRWRGDKARAGYALMDASSGKPVILVDAKKLDEPLLDVVTATFELNIRQRLPSIIDNRRARRSRQRLNNRRRFRLLCRRRLLRNANRGRRLRHNGRRFGNAHRIISRLRRISRYFTHQSRYWRLGWTNIARNRAVPPQRQRFQAHFSRRVG